MGDTVIDAVVAPPGLHKKLGVVALCVAINTAEPPGQIDTEFTLTLGGGFTVTVAQLVTLAHAPVTSTQ